MAIVRAGDLDIDVDMVFLGFLGPGPLSRATASLPGVLEAEYSG